MPDPRSDVTGDDIGRGAGADRDVGGAAVSTRPARRLGIGAAIVLALAALAITIGVGVLRTATTPARSVPGPSASARAAASATPTPLYVHVAGAVRAPGLYAMSPGARVMDAVAAAGGFAPDAVHDAVNLAAPVTDGAQILIPRVGDVAAAAPAAPGGGGPATTVVNLNSADQAALETLPRIGPALAKRIVDWRTKNGRFRSVDDLMAVPGIGEKMLESLRDLVTV